MRQIVRHQDGQRAKSPQPFRNGAGVVMIEAIAEPKESGVAGQFDIFYRVQRRLPVRRPGLRFDSRGVAARLTGPQQA